MKKLIAILLMTSLALISVFAGGSQEQSGVKTYKIGICNFVDDASLNQICENIQAQLAEIESEKARKGVERSGKVSKGKKVIILLAALVLLATGLIVCRGGTDP